MGVLFYFLGLFPKVDAAKLAHVLRKWGVVAVAFAAGIVATRNIGLAIMAAMLTYSFIQKTGWLPWGGPKQSGGGSVSAVRTAYLEMTLDHASGAMSGRMLQGRFAGRTLSALTAAERRDCFAELQANDAKGAQLFQAYFDRTEPGWTESAGTGGGGSSRSNARSMGVEEAYLVLGLNPGVTREEVQAAHRNLMKRYHPDQGGSNYLASKVNEAKDVLLKHIPA